MGKTADERHPAIKILPHLGGFMEIEKRFTFEAAHKLCVSSWSDAKNQEVFGKCFFLHGHSYKLFISLAGDRLESGMVVHFTKFKNWVNETIVTRLDHTYLNELPEFAGLPTTVENIALKIGEILGKNWIFPGLRLQKITLFETETSSASLNF